MDRTIALSVLILNCLLCSSLAVAQEPKPAKPPLTDVQILAQGNNQFALTLHRQLASQSDKDFVVSPFSVSTALAIVHAGARGETGAEMAKALHFELPVDRQAKAFNKLLGLISDSHGDKKRFGELSVANGLWVEKSYPIRNEFVTLIQNSYQGKAQLLDFKNDSEEGRKIINRWVEEKTHDRIKGLLHPENVNTETKMVVTNAVYLNKIWLTPFMELLTKDGDFYTGTKKRSLPMMHGMMDTAYFQGDGISLLELPYNCHSTAMFILLPDEKSDLKKIEQDLDWTKLKGWIEKKEIREVTITLPRVKMEGRNSLVPALNAMGMRTPFGVSADFSGIIPGGKVQISDIIHQAYLSMDEKETEAAAATAVTTIVPTGAHIPAPKATFKANRPFLMFIIEDIEDYWHHTILFTARFTGE